MYKKANIRSRAEAQERLENGETFHFSGRGSSIVTAIRYDKTYIRKGQSPYRFNSMALKDVCLRYAEWKVEVEDKWYNNIPSSGVLCWVGDGEYLVKKHMGIVTGYTEPSSHTSRYTFDTTYMHFKFAEPVTEADVRGVLNDYL